MGLSPDPEKRAKQLANLQKGWPTVAARLAPDASESPAQNGQELEAEAPAPAGIPVLDYEPAHAPTPAPEPGPEPPAGPEPEPPAGPEPEPELEHDDEPRGGFLSGFFGG